MGSSSTARKRSEGTGARRVKQGWGYAAAALFDAYCFLDDVTTAHILEAPYSLVTGATP